MNNIPVGPAFEAVITFFVDEASLLTRAFSDFVNIGVATLSDILLAPPAMIAIGLFTALIFHITQKAGITLFAALGQLLIYDMGLWAPTITTLALVMVATIIAIGIGVPLGILAAISKGFHRIAVPFLDFMQTLPAFVYLIPAVAFFGLGATAGLFATVIFAMPPAIRLTDLGIRQVPEDLVEASDAFGANTTQKLIKLQLPLALPSIQAGINQCIMLSLSMVVIAALIGAGGVGYEVWKEVQQLNKGSAFEAGLSIVILAIILDRVMQNTSNSKQRSSS